MRTSFFEINDKILDQKSLNKKKLTFSLRSKRLPNKLQSVKELPSRTPPLTARSLLAIRKIPKAGLSNKPILQAYEKEKSL